MPAAPRMRTKATQIAFKVQGVPPNIAYKPTPRARYINRRLLNEETVRVR